MAVVNYNKPITRTDDPLTWIVVWEGLTASDTGEPFDVTIVRGAGGPDRSVQVVGTFATDTVVIQGSNDGTNYATLTDPQGNAISFTATGLEQITEYTRLIRPSTSGGSGDIDVYLVVRGRH